MPIKDLELRKIKAREYYLKNKERILLKTSEYRKNNQYKIIAYQEKGKKERLKNRKPNKTKEEKALVRNKWVIKNKSNLQNYREVNKEKIRKQQYDYNRTPKGKKRMTISNWKNWGIISNDFDIVYDKYINCNNCEFCKVEFKNSRDRHLDHNHYITDDENIRGILCRSCNYLDVYVII